MACGALGKAWDRFPMLTNRCIYFLSAGGVSVGVQLESAKGKFESVQMLELKSDKGRDLRDWVRD